MTDDAADFGDWEPEDSIVADNRPDAEQVARRLHELRAWLAAQAADLVPERWGLLSDDERAVAVALGVELARHLLDVGGDGAAIALHDARRYLDGTDGWDDLDADTQAVALAIVDAVVDWLRSEGTEVA